MTNFIKNAALLGFLVAATQGLAQDDTTTEETTTVVPSAEAFDLGEAEVPEIEVGQLYLREVHGDWQVRCVKTEDSTNEPCQIYQTLMTPAPEGSEGEAVPIAEVNILRLPDGTQVVAGATIAVPLLTLLTEQLRVSIDGGQARLYDFTTCDTEGCYARIGFTADDIAAFKRGNGAVVTIVPALAPEDRVNITMSLTGFTAGFDTLAN
ncbi:invasion associated locus B family protein [Cochlodiniinecator piscidefendens]|uniref:invasion associated locus B family protein n=1 Tax=Cochlodiniinecator piscidefendens TaxID=2715756 RepID=UPI00140C22DC|nr:invasion associated locus B family protein [Cochlodiniinecator piscidefendens]